MFKDKYGTFKKSLMTYKCVNYNYTYIVIIIIKQPVVKKKKKKIVHLKIIKVAGCDGSRL